MSGRPTVVYIAGSGRSGSTLLDRMLGGVDGVVSTGELVHLWARGLADDQLCGCGERFLRCPFWADVGDLAFGGWGAVDPDEILRLQRAVDRQRFIPLMLAPGLSRRYGRDLARYGVMLSTLYRAIARVGDGRVVVDSSKHASTAYLLRTVPGVDLRVVHLVRDPRGVAHSWNKTVRRPEVAHRMADMPRYHPARSGAQWLGRNGQLDTLSQINVPVLRLRYEDLVADPRRHLSDVLGFAGEPAPGSALSFIAGDGTVHLQPSHTVAGNPMRFRHGPTHLHTDDAWRTQFDRTSRYEVTAVTWPLLRRYGYLPS